MIKPEEFRPGNYVLYKLNGRIRPVQLDRQMMQQLNTMVQDLFPVVLNPDLFLKAGFMENKDYELLPEAREFMLPLPVSTSQETEIRAYMKSNRECFARYHFNSLPASNTVHQLHQLQNLYHALTGKELPVQL